MSETANQNNQGAPQPSSGQDDAKLLKEFQLQALQKAHETAKHLDEVFEKEKHKFFEQVRTEIDAKTKKATDDVTSHYARFEKLVVAICGVFALMTGYFAYKTYDDIPNRVNTSVTERVNTSVSKVESDISKSLEKSQEKTEKEIERTKNSADKAIKDAADNAKQRFDLFESTLKVRMEDFSRDSHRQLQRIQEEDREFQKKQFQRESESSLAFQFFTNAFQIQNTKLQQDMLSMKNDMQGQHLEMLRTNNIKLDYEFRGFRQRSSEFGNELTNKTMGEIQIAAGKLVDVRLKENFDTMRRETTGQLIKTFLSGMSDNEQEFLEVAFSVSESMSEAQMRELLNFMERSAVVQSLAAAKVISNGLVQIIANTNAAQDVYEAAFRIAIANNLEIARLRIKEMLLSSDSFQVKRAVSIVGDIYGLERRVGVRRNTESRPASSELSKFLFFPLHDALSKGALEAKQEVMVALLLLKWSAAMSGYERTMMIKWSEPNENVDFWSRAKFDFADRQIFLKYELLLNNSRFAEFEKRSISERFAQYIASHYSTLRLMATDYSNLESKYSNISSEFRDCIGILKTVYPGPSQTVLEIPRVFGTSGSSTAGKAKPVEIATERHKWQVTFDTKENRAEIKCLTQNHPRNASLLTFDLRNLPFRTVKTYRPDFSISELETFSNSGAGFSLKSYTDTLENSQLVVYMFADKQKQFLFLKDKPD